MRHAVFWIIPLVLAVACCKGNNCPTPNPIPPDTGTGGGGALDAGTPCQVMCDHLATLPCPEEQSSCVRLCVLNSTDERFAPTAADGRRYIDCRLNAKTVVEAQACGPASCR